MGIISSNTTKRPPDKEPGRERAGKCHVMQLHAASSSEHSSAVVATPLTECWRGSGSICLASRGAIPPSTATRDSSYFGNRYCVRICSHKHKQLPIVLFFFLNKKTKIPRGTTPQLAFISHDATILFRTVDLIAFS